MGWRTVVAVRNGDICTEYCDDQAGEAMTAGFLLLEPWSSGGRAAMTVDANPADDGGM